MEGFDLQPPKQPSWDQMDLRTKSMSFSSTIATPLSSSSLSKLSGLQIGQASNGQYGLMYSHHNTDQAPEIPRAIPTPYSFNDGSATLDGILENPPSTLNPTTNFYIRGFDPNTIDAMIQQYRSRSGGIETAKSIIDHLTNTCKGYGFIKYYSFPDAENCLRGFFCRGHEAKFAKLGHNAGLKTLGSPDITNLYFEVLSQKFLRDSEGINRGVRFARFKSPQVWKVIESFQGKNISKETDFTILQLRDADKEQQKMLKMETNISPLQSYPPNQLHSSSQNTARNILRLLVISIFAAPMLE